jgi:hypothetical protein
MFSSGKERRDTLRVPIAVHAIVRAADRSFQLFRTRDLSLEGAFVETGSYRFSASDKVEIALKIPSDGVSRVYRLNARVIRIAPSGVGMVFERIDPESYAALLECVFGAHTDMQA